MNDEVFVTAVNNLLNLSADKALIAVTVSVSEKDLAKIGAVQAPAARSIKSTGPVFDLQNRMQAAAFISAGA